MSGSKLLENMTAVVTGCRRGIGKSIVLEFAKNGANIFACVREPNSEFSRLVEEVGHKYDVLITPIYFDLKDETETKVAAQKIIGEADVVDILVNNAGIVQTSPFQMTPLEKVKELFQINYFSQILFSQIIIRKMLRKKRGSIVNMASSAGLDHNEGRVSYAGSKAALISTTKVMAKELAHYNIRVNCVAPGLTNTDMLYEGTGREKLDDTLGNILMRRVGEPFEIANAVVYLASDMSSYVTGQVLRVDGGLMYEK